MSKRKKKRPLWKKLNYWKARNVWRKGYGPDNKKYILGKYGVPETEETHALAWAEWIQLKARLDAQANRRSAQDYLLEGPDTQEEVLKGLLHHAKLFAEANGLQISLTEMLERTWYADTTDSEGAVINDLPPPSRKSKGVHLKDLVEDFNRYMKNMAANKQRSAARAGTLGGHLKFFLDWAGDNKTTGDVVEELVKSYHTHVLTEHGAPSTKRDRWGAFKQFIKWMAEQKYCALPANLDSKAFNFRVPAKQPTPAAIADIKAVLINPDLDEQLKLYLLMMINTGMQQTDLANMTAGMFDATRGTITRVRSKTAHHVGAPTITYTLWPETLALLTKHMKASAKPNSPLLLSPKGEPLVTRDVSGGRTDRIRNAWITFTKKLGAKAPALQLKQIRKTGATLIDHQFGNDMSNQYLADAPSGVRARNYVPPSQANFDIALAWLRTQVV